MNPTIGRLVLFRLGGTDEYPTLRPALVVNMDGSGQHVNLKVDLDPSNDEVLVDQLVRGRPRETNMFYVEIAPALAWEAVLRPGAALHLEQKVTTLYASSCPQGEGLGEWRWPVRT